MERRNHAAGMAVTNVTGPSEDVREVVGDGKGDVGRKNLLIC